MANPLYQMLMANQMQNTSKQPMFANPMQKMNYILQAMRNPAAFVKSTFPDIPDEISNDPNKILEYLQKTRNISNQDINNVMSQFNNMNR